MRLAFAGIAVLILILAIVVLSGNGDDNSNDEKPAAQATATATATATGAATDTATPEATETPTPTPTVDPGPLLTGEKVVKIEVNKGDTVRFRILSPKDDEVHVHGYDLKKDVKANQQASMSFKATIDGIFDIEFENEGQQIASLRVNP
jgi:hypothetical protein